MIPNLLAYKNSTLAWYKLGTGPKQVICFHGYAEDGTSFDLLAAHLRDTYTIYAIDLPYHGATEWSENREFTHIDLQEVIKAIIPGSQKWSLMGFSLGGRICLSLYQCDPARVERLV